MYDISSGDEQILNTTKQLMEIIYISPILRTSGVTYVSETQPTEGLITRRNAKVLLVSARARIRGRIHLTRVEDASVRRIMNLV